MLIDGAFGLLPVVVKALRCDRRLEAFDGFLSFADTGLELANTRAEGAERPLPLSALGGLALTSGVCLGLVHRRSRRRVCASKGGCRGLARQSSRGIPRASGGGCRKCRRCGGLASHRSPRQFWA